VLGVPWNLLQNAKKPVAVATSVGPSENDSLARWKQSDRDSRKRMARGDMWCLPGGLEQFCTWRR